MTSPLDLKHRTFLPSVNRLNPTFPALLVVGSTNATLEQWMTPSRSIIPPCSFLFGLGRVCFFTMLTPSTTSRWFSITHSTAPDCPLLLPVSTSTLSPFLIFLEAITLPLSKHLRRQ